MGFHMLLDLTPILKPVLLIFKLSAYIFTVTLGQQRGQQKCWTTGWTSNLYVREIALQVTPVIVAAQLCHGVTFTLAYSLINLMHLSICISYRLSLGFWFILN